MKQASLERAGRGGFCRGQIGKDGRSSLEARQASFASLARLLREGLGPGVATMMKSIRINALEISGWRAKACARQLLPTNPAGLAGRE
jgi:hypothetical protein